MAKVGTLKLDGFTVRAEVVAPGLLVINTPGAMQINDDEVPEGRDLKSRLGLKRGGDGWLFTSRGPVIRRVLHTGGKDWLKIAKQDRATERKEKLAKAGATHGEN